MSDDPEELWAWMTTKPDGETSLVGALIDGRHTPLITSREHLARGSLRDIALDHRAATGQPIRLVHYIADRTEEEPWPSSTKAASRPRRTAPRAGKS